MPVRLLVLAAVLFVGCTSVQPPPPPSTSPPTTQPSPTGPLLVQITASRYGHVEARVTLGASPSAKCIASAILPSGIQSEAIGLTAERTLTESGVVSWSYNKSASTRPSPPLGEHVVRCRPGGFGGIANEQGVVARATFTVP